MNLNGNLAKRSKKPAPVGREFSHLVSVCGSEGFLFLLPTFLATLFGLLSLLARCWVLALLLLTNLRVIALLLLSLQFLFFLPIHWHLLRASPS